MAKIDVLLGLQWGDEGKGKVVDVLTPRYDAVARFQGGPNAGHTLEFDGGKYILRSIPSGVFQGHCNVIGNGVVIDPVLFRAEAEELERGGLDLKKRLQISRKAHLIMPTHRLLDAAQEAAKGDSKVGTTGKGIGPAYTDKTARAGLRVGDTERADFRASYEKARQRHLAMLGRPGAQVGPVEVEKEWFEAVEYLKQYTFIDSEYAINGLLDAEKSVLAEGAQGTLLDVDFGSYPFVTSSNTVCAGACTGLGVAPRRIGEVFGIFKAYCTRVGAGPFPTELFDETAQKMREIGREFGSVTGRERRCGWLDLVALKYAIMLNGVTQLIMMKGDVMNDFETVKICTSYEGSDGVPYDLGASKPIYKEFEGWRADLRAHATYESLPVQFKKYVEFIEHETGVPIRIISTGPDRAQTIIR